MSRRAESLAVKVVSAALRPLPRRAALSLGRGLGRLWSDLDPRHVAIAADNLKRAFPEWPDERVLRTACAVYAHFGAVLFDILWMEKRPIETLRSLFRQEGTEHMRAALAKGKGVLVATAHVGNWETQGVVHASVFGPMGVVARPIDNPEIDSRLVAFRERTGNKVIYKRRALIEVLKILKRGELVSVLIDQNVQEQDGIFVDFFGRPAATTTVAAAVTVKTGCTLMTGRSVLEPDGTYRGIYEPPVVWEPTGDRTADITALTQALTQRIENWVREIPEQWLWIHRRWKTQPNDSARGA